MQVRFRAETRKLKIAGPPEAGRREGRKWLCALESPGMGWSSMERKINEATLRAGCLVAYRNGIAKSSPVWRMALDSPAFRTTARAQGSPFGYIVLSRTVAQFG